MAPTRGGLARLADRTGAARGSGATVTPTETFRSSAMPRRMSLAARENGIRAIAVRTGITPPEDLEAQRAGLADRRSDAAGYRRSSKIKTLPQSTAIPKYIRPEYISAAFQLASALHSRCTDDARDSAAGTFADAHFFGRLLLSFRVSRHLDRALRPGRGRRAFLCGLRLAGVALPQTRPRESDQRGPGARGHACSC